ncbi:MAG: DMT family transporter [Gammaproteobacteria bacterium]|nr:DMT family transporter [Gammaproteobacteria bacterium]
MRSYDVARLLALAAMWSLQYLFMRVAVPALGFELVAEMRALFAALFLLPAAIVLGQRPRLYSNRRVYFRVSLINNVLPFICFAYAAASLPAGYLSIINGTVPMWTALCAAWLLREPLGGRRIVGFALGLVGVVLIVQLGPVALDAQVILAALVGLLGAAFWGWGGVMIKQHTGEVPAIALAAGSICFSALLLSPAWVTATDATWTVGATISAIALGVVGSGIAYLAFFTLVRDIGPSRTLSVTFLIPVLGVLWGWLLLDEAVTVSMIVGGIMVVAALGLVMRR